ncbi:MAG: multicopper oxidase domain-containing protein [Chthoniobacteraceae bacterium]
MPSAKKYFDLKIIDRVVKLGSTEAWTISNNRTFGHSFHVHDGQFKIISRSNGPVENYEQGWKDTLYVPKATSATFIAKFEEFASDTAPFLYHCDTANHEDGGLMGQFLVSKEPAALKRDASGNIRFRAAQHPLTLEMLRKIAQQERSPAPGFSPTGIVGSAFSLASLTNKKPLVHFSSSAMVRALARLRPSSRNRRPRIAMCAQSSV